MSSGGYELRKGTVHFPLTKPVSVKLISRIAKLPAADVLRRNAIRIAERPASPDQLIVLDR
jgi:hypothetical protein